MSPNTQIYVLNGSVVDLANVSKGVGDNTGM